MKHSCDKLCGKISQEAKGGKEFKPTWNSLSHLEQKAYLEFHGARVAGVPMAPSRFRNLLRAMFRWTQR